MDQKSSQYSTVKSTSVDNLFDPQTVIIGTTLLVLLLTIVFYFFTKKSSRNSILLVGLADSGKTTLITQLVHNVFVSTVTSMQENEEKLAVKGQRKLINLVDIPGFDRLRGQFWDKFKSRARAVIYVVDSVNFMSNIHNVADLLYQYLCDDFVTSNRIPFLVACTKQDEARAKTAKLISTQLEKEFNTIRETRIGALDSTSGEDNSKKMLGNPNREFTFADLKNSIEFVDCSAHKENKNFDNVLKWIDTVA